jgi:hypothetical protein
LTIAAIYLPSPGRDVHYHAFSGCKFGGIRIRLDGKYRVNTEQYAKALDKRPCPECWTWLGYHVEWEHESIGAVR